MAEQCLDDADIGALLQKMRGETVAQRLHSNGLADPGDGTLHEGLHTFDRSDEEPARSARADGDAL
jgi:hypothetical protein